MITWIFLVVIINFHISFKLNFVSTTNFFSDLISVRTSQTYRLFWYGFFSFCPGTYTLGYCMKICYCINFKSWMKYCACWKCDDMLLGLLIPIIISIYLHITKILCFNDQLHSSYNLSINCCVILYCICFWYEYDNVKSIGCCVSFIYGSIVYWFN